MRGFETFNNKFHCTVVLLSDGDSHSCQMWICKSSAPNHHHKCICFTNAALQLKLWATFPPAPSDKKVMSESPEEGIFFSPPEPATSLKAGQPATHQATGAVSQSPLSVIMPAYWSLKWKSTFTDWLTACAACSSTPQWQYCWALSAVEGDVVENIRWAEVRERERAREWDGQDGVCVSAAKSEREKKKDMKRTRKNRLWCSADDCSHCTTTTTAWMRSLFFWHSSRVPLMRLLACSLSWRPETTHVSGP